MKYNDKNENEIIDELNKEIESMGNENKKLREELNYKKEEKNHDIRKIIDVVSLVIISLLLILSTYAVWFNQYVINTDGWVSVVSPVLKDPGAINAISSYAASSIVTSSNLTPRLETSLPTDIKFAAVPITNQVQSFIQKQIGNIIASDKFYTAFQSVISTFHTNLIFAFEGQTNKITISDNKLTLNLVPIVGTALSSVSDKLPGLVIDKTAIAHIQYMSPAEANAALSQAIKRPLPANFAQITIVNSSYLSTVKNLINVTSILAWLLPILAGILIAISIISPIKKYQYIKEMGIVISILFILNLFLSTLLQSTLSSQLNSGLAKSVGSIIISNLFGKLNMMSVWMIIVGLFITLIGFIADNKYINDKIEELIKNLSPTMKSTGLSGRSH